MDVVAWTLTKLQSMGLRVYLASNRKGTFTLRVVDKARGVTSSFTGKEVDQLTAWAHACYSEDDRGKSEGPVTHGNA